MSGPLVSREIRGLFSRISRGGSLLKRASCLHERMFWQTYGEQREREMRSISSLCLFAYITTHKKERKNGEKIIYIRISN